jgi:Trypsin
MRKSWHAWCQRRTRWGAFTDDVLVAIRARRSLLRARHGRRHCAVALGLIAACALAATPALGRTPLRLHALLTSRVVPLHAPGRLPAAPQARAAIVGGSDAAQGDWGFLALVQYYDATTGSYTVCTGTVVSPNVVLTAGHCGIDLTTGATLDPAGYTIATGTLDWTDASQRQLSGVSQVIVNPAYDPTTKLSDAALLVLSAPTTAPSIRLATSADSAVEQGGVSALVAGWGEIYAGSGLPARLLWAPLTLGSSDYCGQYDPFFDGSVALCAADPLGISGVCFGDSGGPLVTYDGSLRPVEIGITSHVIDNCSTTTADYFAAVDPMSSWLADSINSVALPSPPQPTSGAKLPLPGLASSDAHTLVRETLASALGRRFKQGHRYQTRCARQSDTRFRCDATFWYGPNDYSARVIIFYVSGSDGTLYWNDTYAIKWVNDRCYFHTSRPRRCKVYTKRGS